jgi:uroporphyrinogen decarboxylase
MAVQHVQPDKVPWSISLTSAARDNVAEYYAEPRLAEPEYFSTWVGNHFAPVGPTGKGQFHGLEEQLEPGIWRDGWGVIWDTRGVYGEGEWGRPINCVLTEPNLENFEFPEPPGRAEFSHFPSFIEDNKEKFISGQAGHLFEVAWALRGIENFFMDMVLHPDFVDDLMKGIMDYYLAVIDLSLEFDIDAFAFGDDWGSQNKGLMMGPAHWRRFIKPYLAPMFSRIKDAGKSVYIHSDGQVEAIFDDLIEIGLDIYNPFQPEIMDVYQLKKEYGDQLCFHGGIGIQDLLVQGTPQQVKSEVQRMIDVIGAGGGYILSPAHSVLADTPVQNIVTMIEVFKSQ